MILLKIDSKQREYRNINVRMLFLPEVGLHCIQLAGYSQAFKKQIIKNNCNH